eukprot:NODE_4899_length_630_cov_248.114783.p4 GENE.NODE_4899_length_630_cov_248.114783~~NODE_4899_length_630_cov_248.114783.p4  ORF type:complete len:60 (-),score=9.47 NODE_4899_length_630_cov_248.114783:433-612(-)
MGQDASGSEVSVAASSIASAGNGRAAPSSCGILAQGRRQKFRDRRPSEVRFSDVSTVAA